MTRISEFKFDIPISNKHCNVQGSQYPELGRWAEEQRLLYERKQIGKETRSDLTDEWEAKLMALGFVFEATSSDDEDKDWTTAVSKPSCIPYKIYSKYVNL